VAFPDSSALEKLWDGSLGDAITIKTASDGSADAYGEKLRTYSAGTSARGRVKILKAMEVNKEFGYLRPGDAVALLKNSATIGQNDMITYANINYLVTEIVQKKTHIEVAMRRMD